MDEDKDRYEKHMERIRAQKRELNELPPYAPPYAPPTYAPPTYAESQRTK
jgi:hypothetical protein